MQFNVFAPNATCILLQTPKREIFWVAVPHRAIRLSGCLHVYSFLQL